jgi:hypothetical protein
MNAAKIKQALQAATASLDELREWQQGDKAMCVPPVLMTVLTEHVEIVEGSLNALREEITGVQTPAAGAVTGAEGDTVELKPECQCRSEEGEPPDQGLNILSLPHEVMVQLFMYLAVPTLCKLALVSRQFRDDIASHADQIYSFHTQADFGFDEATVCNAGLSALSFYCECATMDMSGEWECWAEGAQGTLGYTINVTHVDDQISGHGTFPAQAEFPPIPLTLSGQLDRRKRMLLTATITWENFGHSQMQIPVDVLQPSLCGPYSQGGDAFNPDAIAGQFHAHVPSRALIHSKNLLGDAEDRDDLDLILESNSEKFHEWHRIAMSTQAAVDSLEYSHAWKSRELRAARLLVKESRGRCPTCGCTDAYGTNIVHGWPNGPPAGCTSESETESVYFACGKVVVRRRPAPPRAEWGGIHVAHVPFKAAEVSEQMCMFVGHNMFVGGAIGRWLAEQSQDVDVIDTSGELQPEPESDAS